MTGGDASENVSAVTVTVRRRAASPPAAELILSTSWTPPASTVPAVGDAALFSWEVGC